MLPDELWETSDFSRALWILKSWVRGCGLRRVVGSTWEVQVLQENGRGNNTLLSLGKLGELLRSTSSGPESRGRRRVSWRRVWELRIRINKYIGGWKEQMSCQSPWRGQGIPKSPKAGARQQQKGGQWGRTAAMSKGVHLKGLRLGGTRSGLHYQKKLMTLRGGQGKGCKWEVRLAALEGMMPAGDIWEAESNAWALTTGGGPWRKRGSSGKHPGFSIHLF